MPSLMDIIRSRKKSPNLEEYTVVVKQKLFLLHLLSYGRLPILVMFKVNESCVGETLFISVLKLYMRLIHYINRKIPQQLCTTSIRS